MYGVRGASERAQVRVGQARRAALNRRVDLTFAFERM